jgi:hypothetical protein
MPPYRTITSNEEPRFFEWLTENRDVFAAYKASLGFVWA